MGFAVHKQFVLVLLFCFLVTLNCIVSKKKRRHGQSTTSRLDSNFRHKPFLFGLLFSGEFMLKISGSNQ